MFVKKIILIASLALTGCGTISYEGINSNSGVYNPKVQTNKIGSELNIGDFATLKSGDYIFDNEEEITTTRRFFKISGGDIIFSFKTMGIDSNYVKRENSNNTFWLGSIKIGAETYEVFEINKQNNRLIAYDIKNRKLYKKSLMRNEANGSFMEGVDVTSEGGWIDIIDHTSSKKNRNFIRYLGEVEYSFRFEYFDNINQRSSRVEFPSSQKEIRIGDYLFKVMSSESEILRLQRLL